MPATFVCLAICFAALFALTHRVVGIRCQPQGQLHMFLEIILLDMYCWGHILSILGSLTYLQSQAHSTPPTPLTPRTPWQRPSSSLWPQICANSLHSVHLILPEAMSNRNYAEVLQCLIRIQLPLQSTNWITNEALKSEIHHVFN